MNGVHNMALQFEVETLEGIDEGLHGLYAEHNGKFRLSVSGIDPADELKEALRKEREEKSAAKTKLTEYERQGQEADRKRMEERQEFESLYKSEQEGRGKLAKELDDLKTNIANEKRTFEALKVSASLTKDEARSGILQKEALQFIYYTPDGMKINGPDGEAWDTAKLTEYLRTRYPFLVDGSQAAGGGATGASRGGATSKKFSEYNAAELSAIRKSEPAEYDRLKSER